MVASAAGLGWQRCQDALRKEVGRVRSIRDLGAGPVVGHWNLAEVALHLSQVWLGIPGLARGDRSGIEELLPERAGVAGEVPMRGLADLGAATSRVVRADPERDLSVLAGRIEARARQHFAECAGRSAEEPRAWMMQGVTLPLSAFTGHLLRRPSCTVTTSPGRPAGRGGSTQLMRCS